MKKTISRNFRVIIDVGEPIYVHKDHPDYREKMRQETENVATKIRAIVHAFADGHVVRSEWDDLFVCPYCGETWLTAFGPYNSCCDEASAERDTLEQTRKVGG